jgi:hypothetical protein
MVFSESFVDEFERNGFVVAPGLLSPVEVTALRTAADAAVERVGRPLGNGRVVPNAAVGAPELGWLFAHSTILDGARAALRSRDIVFTMEADVHRNLVNGKWHKDTGEQVLPRGYFDCDPIGRPDCRVVKVALYLQDHLDGSGLRVRVGSHRFRELDIGEESAVRTRAGDAVFFDVRATHRGVSAAPIDYVIAGGALAIPARRRGDTIDRIRRAQLRRRGRPDRIAVYFAFGVPGERTRTFTHRNLARQLAQTGAAVHALDQAVAGRLTEAGVELVEV